MNCVQRYSSVEHRTFPPKNCLVLDRAYYQFELLTSMVYVAIYGMCNACIDSDMDCSCYNFKAK